MYIVIIENVLLYIAEKLNISVLAYYKLKMLIPLELLLK